MNKAMKKAGLEAKNIDVVSMHATGTSLGDIQEAKAVREVFDHSDNTLINATKGFIGHCMGAAGALELAGNVNTVFAYSGLMGSGGRGGPLLEIP